MTTASKVTLVRIAMVPVFLVAALVPFNGHDWVALGIFLVAAFTDSLDGYIARKYDQVSDFGKFIDPIADKLLVTAALLVFMERGQISSWAVFVVVAREFLISGLRQVAVEKGIVIAAGVAGKVKTAASVLCIGVMFLPVHGAAIWSWITVDVVCVGVILITTVYSGIEYFVDNWAVFRD